MGDDEFAAIKARWAAADYGLNEWGEPIGGEQAKADIDWLTEEVEQLRGLLHQLGRPEWVRLELALLHRRRTS